MEIEAHPVYTVGSYLTLCSIPWDVYWLDDLKAGLLDIFGGCSRRLDLTDERGELPTFRGKKRSVNATGGRYEP